MNTAEERVHDMKEKIQLRVVQKVGKWHWSILIRGVFAVILGLSALFWPGQTMSLLTKLLGSYFIIDAFTGVIGLWKENESKDTPLMIQTVLNLTLGLALLVWTGISAKLFMSIAGIWLVLQGAGLYHDSKKLGKDNQNRTLMSLVGGVIVATGLVFLFWQKTGITAISYLTGFSLLLIGGLLIYLAKKLKAVQGRIQNI